MTSRNAQSLVGAGRNFQGRVNSERDGLIVTTRGVAISPPTVSFPTPYLYCHYSCHWYSLRSLHFNDQWEPIVALEQHP